jgi:predicted ribosome quality control (RQC) complex YloA/Tae2 family protein
METFKPSLHMFIHKLYTWFCRFVVVFPVFQYIVDNVMLTNYYTLRFIASTLDSTTKGWKIRDVFTQRKDELTIAFEEDPRHLIISCRPDAPIVYLHPEISRARRNTVDLLQASLGTTVGGVFMHPSDRVITMALDSGLMLKMLFFGSKSNVLLTNDKGVVIDAFKNAGEVKGSVAAFPVDDIVHDFSLFRTAVADSGAVTIAAVLRKSFPRLGSTLTDEALTRAGCLRSASASSLEPAAIDILEDALRSVLFDMNSPRPRVYLDTAGRPCTFSLLPLTHREGIQERLFDDIHEALRFYTGRKSAAVGIDAERGAIRAALHRVIEKGERTRQAVTEDAQRSDRARDYAAYAGLLMGNLDSVHKGSRKVTIATAGGEVTIPLDPALSPVQNAQKYFEKTKRARTAGREGGERLHDIEERIEQARRLLAGIEQCTTKDEQVEFVRTNAAELDRFGIGRKAEQREQLPFRLFVVDGGFEVWAGKNSTNNDLLTLRHAKPADLWFHARGSGGSHVVLKVGTGRGEPGKKAREEAAGIAAYYSKMKNAKMVPVAMTEKRYVRKPKGAPPGTVVIEREKVIFAEPALPAPQKNGEHA